MKKCELCKFAAKAYCESDQASLCWDCDTKVHSANFLVARHSRSLLCSICQSPTPWTATGEKLGHTVSVCVRCAKNGGQEGDESEEVNHSGDDEETDEDDDEAEEREEEEEGENQVVPWSDSSTPPPPASSSSSGGESSMSGFSSSKRMRNQENLSCSLSHRNLTRASSVDSFQHPPKHQRAEQDWTDDHQNHYRRVKGKLTGESGVIDLNLPASPPSH